MSASGATARISGKHSRVGEVPRTALRIASRRVGSGKRADLEAEDDKQWG